MSRAVLIADDDPFVRRLVATTLGDVAGYELLEAADGEEAVEVARSERPDLVFLDVDMPRLDGVEACRRLRAEEGSQATIVMLTAAAGEPAERRAEEAGCDLYLTKPFSPLELLRLVDGLQR